MAKKKNPNEGYCRHLLYESLEERYFFEWCFELMDRGYIKDIQRAQSFLLSKKITSTYIQQLKTKTKEVSQTILREHTYTPECEIVWTEEAYPFLWKFVSGKKKEDKHLFVTQYLGKEPCSSLVEIKPSFDFNNMERLVKINIAWMYEQYRIFVNLIKIKDLFEKSFTPNAYLFTPTGKKRVINDINVRTCDEFLNKQYETV